MALTERTRVREILFVQDDTTLVWHAHQVPITEILKDGKVVSATYAPAAPLDVKGAGKVLEPAVIAICAERDELKKRVAELEAQMATKQ